MEWIKLISPRVGRSNKAWRSFVRTTSNWIKPLLFSDFSRMAMCLSFLDIHSFLLAKPERKVHAW